VTANTEIGDDLEKGLLLRAEVEGTVEGVYFSGGDHALVVLVRLDFGEQAADGDA